jgi:uncharacterized protein YlxW (UPF0749 family)
MAKKRAKRARRKKGLNLAVLRRAANARVKKLQANIQARNKAIARARKRGDTEAVKEHRQMQVNAKEMIRGLKGIVKAMGRDSCPFVAQADPTG